jgi:chromosome segregation ATPase
MKRIVFVGLMACAACGVKRVPDSIIEKLPYESRIDLLEAENDLAIAVDRLDETRNEVQRTKDQIRRAKERLSAANGEVGAAADAPSKEIARLAVAEAEARLDWLKARQEVNKQEEKLAEMALTCALARFEQSKLDTARKKKIEGSEALDPVEFENQVKKCDEKYAAARDEAKNVTAQADEVKNKWESSKSALAKKTFDARASPYVE